MAVPWSATAPSPPAGVDRHVEVRWDALRSAAPEAAALDTLRDALRPALVRRLDVVIPGLDLPPAVAAAASMLVDGLPALRAITLTAAGARVAHDVPAATALVERLRRSGLARGVDLLLAEDASAVDALGGPATPTPPTSLGAVRDASRALRGAGLAVRWIVPLMPALVHRLEGLFSLARDEGVDPVLVPVDPRAPAGAPLDDDERLFALDFVTYRLLGEERARHPAARTRWYRALERALARGRPVEGAVTRRVAVWSLSEGDGGPRWTVSREARPYLGAGAERPGWRRGRAAGAARAGRAVAHAHALGEVLVDGGHALLAWGRAVTARRRRASADPDARLPSVALVGAYGGEHIGDAAILGGVLLRLWRRHGTTAAVLLSQRPAHTRHLVRMLDTPMPVDVRGYDRRGIREAVARADALVFAGGPLIDVPRQLVKHLYAASRAGVAAKPFIIEGIGPGHFARRSSEWTARRLVRMAARVSVRTSADRDSPLLETLAAEVGRDPAFDYLATRGLELSRLRDADRRWIERLLRDTEGRLRVGLNLRPIGHRLTIGVRAPRRAAHIREVEARFEARLADALRRFHRASSRAPCFVFFPMNAIQFGLSDLRSAYRVKRLAGNEVDLRVWEGDASLDGVVALLRRLDLVVAMRLHATVFAMAEGRPVIGVDYRVGRRDKVTALLEDAGHADRCCRIDEMTSDWLVERLETLAAGLARPADPG